MPDGDRCDDLVRDIHEAIVYCGDALEVGSPARILVTGPLAEGPGLADRLTAQVDLPVETLDASRLVQPLPRRLRGEGWNRWGVALGAATRR